MNVIPGPTAVFVKTADPTTFWRRGALAASAVSLIALGALATTLWQRNAAPGTAAMAESAPAGGVEPLPVTGAQAQPKPVVGTRAQHPGSAQVSGTTPLHTQPMAMQREPDPAAPACAHCGVVETVTTVTHKGEGSGVGAVAGSVLGGVVGSQIGGGGGRKALTVLGVIGGGLAGNEVERRQRATTDYRVTVRMADGSLRSLSQAQAPAVGQPVRIEEGKLVQVNPPASSVAPSSTDHNGDPRTLQTSSRS